MDAPSGVPVWAVSGVLLWRESGWVEVISGSQKFVVIASAMLQDVVESQPSEDQVEVWPLQVSHNPL
jgi:hypothetical protein